MMTPVIVRKTILGEGRPKICIPLMGEDEEQIAGAAKALQEQKLPADLVEWRADSLAALPNPQAVTQILGLLREILGETMPILFTIRTIKEGGQAKISGEEYIACNCAAIEGEADLLDVELSAERETADILIEEAHEKGKKVILSSHDFFRTPSEEEMLRRLRRMQEWNGDISKLSVMPQTPSDVLKLLSITLAMKETYADRPFITMSMGADGLISRLCGESFGSCLTFGCGAKASAPGQMEAKALYQVLEAIHASQAPAAPLKNGAFSVVFSTPEAPVLPCHIFLIGFMGTGKSTIARILSRRLKTESIEMDQRIVEKEGMEINEIFSRHGEEYFRSLETETLRGLNAVKPGIISCGGGIVLREENIRLMQEMGKTVLLTASPETILSRVEGDNSRPNLKGRKTVEGIRELMDQRKDDYQAAAQITISTDQKTPEEVADLVCQEVNIPKG